MSASLRNAAQARKQKSKENEKFLRRCRIFQTQLHRLSAAPGIDVQTARQMEPCTTVVFQCRAKRAVKCAKGDGVHFGVVAVAKTDLEVAFTHPLGKADLHVGKGISRGRGTGPEGACLFHLLRQFHRRGGGHQHAVQLQVCRAGQMRALLGQ